jgi:hypothetical protein
VENTAVLCPACYDHLARIRQAPLKRNILRFISGNVHLHIHLHGSQPPTRGGKAV